MLLHIFHGVREDPLTLILSPETGERAGVRAKDHYHQIRAYPYPVWKGGAKHVIIFANRCTKANKALPFPRWDS